MTTTKTITNIENNIGDILYADNHPDYVNDFTCKSAGTNGSQSDEVARKKVSKQKISKENTHYRLWQNDYIYRRPSRDFLSIGGLIQILCSKKRRPGGSPSIKGFVEAFLINSGPNTKFRNFDLCRNFSFHLLTSGFYQQKPPWRSSIHRRPFGILSIKTPLEVFYP